MSDNAIPAGGYRLTKPVFFIGFMLSLIHISEPTRP